MKDVVVYTPGSHIEPGLRHWGKMAAALYNGRELIWRFFLREFSARYRQSLFGYLWAVMPAIITAATFSFLNRTGTLKIAQTDLPYPVYVLLGMTVWELFATGLTRSAQCLVNARTIITQINFSRETLVVAAFCEATLDFIIRLVVIAAAFVWFDVRPAQTAIYVPLILIPLGAMTVGLGFMLALANAVFRDIGNSLTVLLTFAMFLTPIVYPPPEQGARVLINYMNPVSPFVIAARDLAVKGELSRPGALLWASVFGVLVLFACWRVFHLAMVRIAERV
ncbi:MAG TPA: ABC transporter permease [Anaerohalosphaeraceae bacterium]|jgi:lipopolysaccharide transport system permease protein|nr:ABC transporter permease [Anaerohalosphaeraceae bacterium]HRT49208.1 ABC transporter permease [Anaerohalosphaeraceae bacterium]HRT85253.1 ABC transporter permease [Anaerohalosphaeraceae bacterium]